MGISLGEAFVELGFDVDDNKLKSFNDGIKNLATDVASVTAAAAAAVYTLSNFAKAPVDSATSMRNLNRELGINTDLLQEWSIAAQKTNSLATEQGVFGSIKAMTEKLAEGRAGGSDVFSAYGVLGISNPGEFKNAGEALEALSNSVRRNMSIWKNDWPNVVANLKKVGFDPAMLGALLMTEAQRRMSAQEFMVPQGVNNQLVDLGNKITEISLKWENFKKLMSARYGDEVIRYINDAVHAFDVFAHSLSVLNNQIPHFQEIMVAAGIAITAAWKPFLAIAGAAIFAVEEVAKLIEGKPTVTGSALGALANWGKAKNMGVGDLPENSLSELYKTRLAGQTPAIVHLDQTNPANYGNQPVGKGGIYITNYIDGSKDPKATSDAVNDGLQRVLNNTLPTLNNGGAY